MVPADAMMTHSGSTQHHLRDPLRPVRSGLASDGSTEVTTLSVSYDGMGMITRYEHKDANPSTVAGFAYGRDKVGNPDYELRLHQSDEGDGYTYDGLYRVTATVYDDAAPATPTAPTAGTGSDIFYYDGVGNRTRAYERSASATDYLHNPVNEYTKVASTEWEHDAAGNLTKDDAHIYYWDYGNRLTRVTDQEGTPTVLADFRYDALGRLIEKLADGTTTRHYHDGFRIVEETEGTESPTVERQYAYGAGVDDVLVLFDEDGETYDTYYYLKDPLWTVEALVDEDGSIVEAYAYEVYGKPTIKTGDGGDGDWFDGDETTATSSAKGNPYLFTARRWDAELSFFHYRGRTYAPASGRFISRDPAGYEGSPAGNLYAYAHNGPVVFVDPHGTSARVGTSPATLVGMFLASLRNLPFPCYQVTIVSIRENSSKRRITFTPLRRFFLGCPPSGFRDIALAFIEDDLIGDALQAARGLTLQTPCPAGTTCVLKRTKQLAFEDLPFNFVVWTGGFLGLDPVRTDPFTGGTRPPKATCKISVHVELSPNVVLRSGCCE